MIPIGIDLGTTNSVVAYWHHQNADFAENKEGGRITPSYVYYGDQNPIVGRMARDKGAIDAANVFFDSKRLLATTADSRNIAKLKHLWPFKVDGSQSNYYVTTTELSIPPEQVSGNILNSLLQNVCRRLETKPDKIEAVITVPAYFNMTQKRATLRAAELAGLCVKQLLSEPVAAALCYQHEMDFKDGEIIFTFDLGGGTFDVTIMEIKKKLFKIVALGGDSHLGGRDFDMIIVEEMEKKLEEQLGEEAVKRLNAIKKFKMINLARNTKEALSAAKTDSLNLSDIDDRADDVSFSRNEFEQKSKCLTDKIKECCVKTLQDAKLKPEQIHHVVVVGGGSKMPFIDDLMAEIFGKEKRISKSVSADESIAKGAATYAAKLLGTAIDPKIQDLRIQDALPLSIGVETVGDQFKPVLEHNSPIPSSNSITLTTSRRNQKAAKIPIYEGLYNNIADNTYLGELEVTGLPPGEAGSVSVKIMLSLNMNGILEAEAKIIGTRTVVSTTIEYETRFEITGINSQSLPVGGAATDERREQLPP